MPSFLHVVHRRIVNFETLRAGFDVSEQRVLKPVRIRQRFLQTFRRIFLAFAQHVTHLLPVSAQAQVVQTTVDVNNVASLNHV